MVLPNQFGSSGGTQRGSLPHLGAKVDRSGLKVFHKLQFPEFQFFDADVHFLTAAPKARGYRVRHTQAGDIPSGQKLRIKVRKKGVKESGISRCISLKLE
jgi:hypothetical protein